MRSDRPTDVPGTRSVRRQFSDALLAFSDDPGPANLVRYLAASRDLERSKGSGESPALASATAARAA
jgi:hypothetical protein